MSADAFRAHLGECAACREAWGGLAKSCEVGLGLARRAFAARGGARDRLLAEMVRRELPALDGGGWIPATAEAAAAQPRYGEPLTTVSAPRAAVEAVAAVAGTTPAAVRQAVHRANKAAAPAPAALAMAPGLDVSIALDAIDNHLVSAKRLATELVAEHPELEDRFPVFQMRSALEQATTLLRGMRPSSGQCLYCKWTDEMPRCGACRGSGWLTADQLIDVPLELRDEGAFAGIYVAGFRGETRLRFVLLKDLDSAAPARQPPAGHAPGAASAAEAPTIPAVAGTAAAPSAASRGAAKPALSPQPKPQRRVRIVDEAGDDIPLPDEPWDGDAA